jgi:outer membrane protein OmpA-like peptidoglycan-associated protein
MTRAWRNRDKKTRTNSVPEPGCFLALGFSQAHRTFKKKIGAGQREAKEMQRDLEGAEVQRIGEGIKITFDSGILFDIDKSDLRPVSKTNLAELAKILNKYPDTNILIEGHTDNTGSDDHNMNLSKDRAQSVAFYLATLEVKSARFSIAGYGETQPIVTNDTPEGRQKNRRVDIAVLANDNLKKAAQEKAKG